MRGIGSTQMLLLMLAGCSFISAAVVSVGQAMRPSHEAKPPLPGQVWCARFQRGVAGRGASGRGKVRGGAGRPDTPGRHRGVGAQLGVASGTFGSSQVHSPTKLIFPAATSTAGSLGSGPRRPGPWPASGGLGRPRVSWSRPQGRVAPPDVTTTATSSLLVPAWPRLASTPAPAASALFKREALAGSRRDSLEGESWPQQHLPRRKRGSASRGRALFLNPLSNLFRGFAKLRVPLLGPGEPKRGRTGRKGTWRCASAHRGEARGPPSMRRQQRLNFVV